MKIQIGFLAIFMGLAGYATSWLYFIPLALVVENTEFVSVLNETFFLRYASVNYIAVAHQLGIVVTFLLFFLVILLWFKIKSAPKKFLLCGITWATLYPMISFLNPSLIKQGLTKPFAAVSVIRSDCMANTFLTQDFSWLQFAQISTVNSLSDLHAKIGPPISTERYKERVLHRYSKPISNGDYWLVEIVYDEKKLKYQGRIKYFID